MRENRVGQAAAAIAAASRMSSSRFVAIWVLTYVVPALLLTAVRIAAFKFAPEDIALYLAVYLIVPAWLLVACLQFRMLRSFPLRRGFWLIATFIGGVFGGLAGGLSKIRTAMALEYYANLGVLVSDYDRLIPSDWIFAVAPVLSLTTGCLAAAAVAGLLQSLCLGKSFRASLLWLLASGASAIVAGVAGYGAYWAYIWTMFTIYIPALFIGGPFIADSIAYTIGVAAGLVVYGTLTGMLLQRLLARGIGRNQNELIRQFE